MAGTNKIDDKVLTGVANEGTWPGIDSRFRLIIVAGLRAKQLLHGSKPRIETDKKRHRHTSIALEEVKRGLVPFTKVTPTARRNLTTSMLGCREVFITSATKIIGRLSIFN